MFSPCIEKLQLKVAIEHLEKMAKLLALHIFTAAKQGDAHVSTRNSLDMTSVITIEDYQMNLEAIYSKNPPAWLILATR